jgi:hypothetical protein
MIKDTEKYNLLRGLEVMIYHEFGIVNKIPTYKKRFDRYEPQKYNCIRIDDNLIEPILVKLDSVDCYYHTLQKPGKGLDYFGITLIPPNSMNEFIKVLSSQNEIDLIPLISMVKQAEQSGKFIIHFGI